MKILLRALYLATIGLVIWIIVKTVKHLMKRGVIVVKDAKEEKVDDKV